MAKILYVVHRYLYPGGSEINVQRMAEETVKRNHSVTVFTLQSPEIGNTINGVHITADMGCIFDKWDLIIVHGSCPAQDIVHQNSDRIKSPIYYMLIQPSTNPMAMKGLLHSTYLGCATSFDINHVLKYGDRSKIRMFNYGITPFQQENREFRKMLNIPEHDIIFMSAGGFWPHKKHKELAEAFIESSRPLDATLVLFGYEDKSTSPTTTWSSEIPKHEKIIKALAGGQQHVFDAMFEADLYILNSESEGYGLVILEAMYAETDWISRDLAAGHDLHIFGFGETYSTKQELITLLDEYDPSHKIQMRKKFKTYIMSNHMITHTVTDILSGAGL